MDFVDLAQNCAPSVAVADLAAIVQMQSDFDPYVIRMTSGQVLEIQPKSLDEAVATGTSLVLKGEDIEMGLAGVTMETLNATGNGIKDAFDPCRNLQMTAKLWTDYQAIASNREEILAMFYGRGDLRAGVLTGYAKTIDAVAAKLTGKLDSLQLKPGTINNLPVREWTGNPVTLASRSDEVTIVKEAKHPENDASQPWDVFGQSRTRANVFFQER